MKLPASEKARKKVEMMRFYDEAIIGLSMPMALLEGIQIGMHFSQFTPDARTKASIDAAIREIHRASQALSTAHREAQR